MPSDVVGAMSDLKPLRTVDETAAILNVSRRTVYNLIASGDLEAERIGRIFRIDDEAITRYRRKCKERVNVERCSEPEIRMHVPALSDRRLDPALANRFRQ